MFGNLVMVISHRQSKVNHPVYIYSVTCLYNFELSSGRNVRLSTVWLLRSKRGLFTLGCFLRSRDDCMGLRWVTLKDRRLFESFSRQMVNKCQHRRCSDRRNSSVLQTNRSLTKCSVFVRIGSKPVCSNFVCIAWKSCIPDILRWQKSATNVAQCVAGYCVTAKRCVNTIHVSSEYWVW